MGHGCGELIIRSYTAQNDRVRVEGLESICEVGPADKPFLFTDNLGDPICRIKNSPIYNMLVGSYHYIDYIIALYHMLLLTTTILFIR